MKKKNTRVNAIVCAVLIIVVAVYLSPLILMVVNSLKTYREIMTDVIAMPTKPSFENFWKVFDAMDFPRTFLNTIIVTTVGVFGIVVLGSFAGYKLSRTKSKLSTILFILCIFPMMIPFQSYMITLVQVAKELDLLKRTLGLAVIYWGLGVPMPIFLFHGFVKGIPYELEECARLDGCGAFSTFVKIVFPLMQPITASVVVINAMWLWNDFLLPLLIIGSSGKKTTLQLAAYGFIGQYKMQWQNIMAGAILIIIPALIVYLIFQKQIVKGMVAGAVKG